MTMPALSQRINSPLTIHFDRGESSLVFPSRAIAAVATGEAETAIWHFSPAGLIEQVTVYAEVNQVRDALGLPR